VYWMHLAQTQLHGVSLKHFIMCTESIYHNVMLPTHCIKVSLEILETHKHKNTLVPYISINNLAIYDYTFN
jgi:hypothetical protein